MARAYFAREMVEFKQVGMYGLSTLLLSGLRIVLSLHHRLCNF